MHSPKRSAAKSYFPSLYARRALSSIIAAACSLLTSCALAGELADGSTPSSRTVRPDSAVHIPSTGNFRFIRLSEKRKTCRRSRYIVHGPKDVEVTVVL